VKLVAFFEFHPSDFARIPHARAIMVDQEMFD